MYPGGIAIPGASVMIPTFLLFPLFVMITWLLAYTGTQVKTCLHANGVLALRVVFAAVYFTTLLAGDQKNSVIQIQNQQP